MSDKNKLMLSWILAILFFPTFLLNVDAGMLVGFIAAIIRWDDIKKADNELKASKWSEEPYWVFYGIYIIICAATFMVLKLNGTLPIDHSNFEFKIIILAMSIPHIPLFIKHEYNRYVQEFKR